MAIDMLRGTIQQDFSEYTSINNFLKSSGVSLKYLNQVKADYKRRYMKLFKKCTLKTKNVNGVEIEYYAIPGDIDIRDYIGYEFTINLNSGYVNSIFNSILVNEELLYKIAKTYKLDYNKFHSFLIAHEYAHSRFDGYEANNSGNYTKTDLIKTYDREKTEIMELRADMYSMQLNGLSYDEYNIYRGVLNVIVYDYMEIDEKGKSISDLDEFFNVAHEIKIEDILYFSRIGNMKYLNSVMNSDCNVSIKDMFNVLNDETLHKEYSKNLNVEEMLIANYEAFNNYVREINK